MLTKILKILTNAVRSVIVRKKTQQVAALYVSMLLGVIVSIVISALTTRILGPADYGDYKFLQNIFDFTSTCITFGFFVSGGRLLAKQKDQEQEKRELLGGIVVVTIAVAAAIMIIMFSFSFIQNGLFSNELGYLIRYSIPLLFVYPFQISIENILKGDNRIYDLSIFRLAPSILYLVSLVVLYIYNLLSLETVLILYLACLAFVVVIMSIRLQASFKAIPKNIELLTTETKKYGVHVYFGILSGTATNQLGGVIIALFLDNIAVGFFLLAQMVTLPLVMLFSSIGTTFFKSFSGKQNIQKKALLATIAIAVVALPMFEFFIDDVVEIIYTKEFFPIVPLCRIMAIGAVMLGLGDFFNNFLCANGHGKLARNAAYVRGAINIIGFIYLVKLFGVSGAAYTVLLSGAGYLITIFYFYSRVVKNNEK